MFSPLGERSVALASEHEIFLNDLIQRNKICGILEKDAKIKEEFQNKGL